MQYVITEQVKLGYLWWRVGVREQKSNLQRYGSSAAFSTKSVNLNFVPVACDQKSFPVCGFFIASGLCLG